MTMNSMTGKALKRLSEIGMIPHSDWEGIEDVPFLSNLIEYVEDVQDSALNEQDQIANSNVRLWRVTALLGNIAERLIEHFHSTISDAEIELIVSKAAAKHPSSKGVVIGIQSCLCYWNRTESIQSITSRLGNLLVMTGAIAEGINNPDEW